MAKWEPLTAEELNLQTEMYIQIANGSLEALAHQCALLAHRLTKYEGVPDESANNENNTQEN
jgi:hypothetical protein